MKDKDRLVFGFDFGASKFGCVKPKRQKNPDTKKIDEKNRVSKGEKYV